MNDQDDASRLLAKVTKNLENMTITNPEELSKEIEALNKALEAQRNVLTVGAALQVNDLSEAADKYLTDEAKKALSVKSKNIREVIDLEKEKVTELLYLGVLTRTDKTEDGVKIIAEQLNLLAAGGYIHSCLAPISSVALVKLAGKYPHVAVIAYVHVAEEMKSLAASLCENAITSHEDTKEAHSLKIDLPDGEFFVFERMSVAANMVSAIDGAKTETIYDRANMYLAILPKGTELVSIEPCGISDLSVPYELRFRSPVMDRVKEVKIDYIRACGVNSGHLKQGNVLLAVRYLDKDGKDAYGLN